MSDPNEPPRPEGSGEGPGEAPAPPPQPPPPPPPSGEYGRPDYGQAGYGRTDDGQAGPYPSQPGYDLPAVEHPGGLGERFLARLLDGILLAIVAGTIEAILAAILGVGVGGFGVGGSYAYAVIAAIIGTVINLGYFAYLESSRGQTLGKMVMRLHVQTLVGGLPTLEQAARRNIWLALPLLGVIPFIGGLIGGLGELVAVIMIAVGISSDPDKRPWTDKYAETQVLKRPS
jgi:uncharacterized RDD family membrane protein YckC